MCGERGSSYFLRPGKAEMPRDAAKTRTNGGHQACVRRKGRLHVAAYRVWQEYLLRSLTVHVRLS